MPKITEDEVEQQALGYLAGLGYQVAFGPDLGPDGKAQERATYKDVFLLERLRAALRRINAHLPERQIEEAIARLLALGSPSLILDNQQFHEWLLRGVPVTYSLGGEEKNDHCRLVDFADAAANDWLALNQYTVIDAGHRRPDIVTFLNGIPIAVIELKNPAKEDADVEKAFNQIQTYKKDIRSLFVSNLLCVISDGFLARVGSLSAPWSRYMPWRTIDGDNIIEKGKLELEVMLKGLFPPVNLLEFLRRFVVFEAEGKSEPIKKIAGYHQFHVVRKALAATIRASRPEGDQRIGVVWHTQGSGKSLSMVFFAGALVAAPEMNNPTIVVVTDRNDLDGQLFETFGKCSPLLRQAPLQAESCKDLMEKLTRASGGIIFTTMQKFSPEEGEAYPMLSDRRNIVVIADEAHRSQYGLSARFNKKGLETYGFAKYLRDALPGASFIGFTGTPVEAEDRNTPVVFGDYIDVYDIQRAVEDGATVPIYYEMRMAKLELPEDQQAKVDEEFDEVFENEEEEVKERYKTKWSALAEIVGAEPRLRKIAADIDQHFASRLEALEGKAMIVGMSRAICAKLYELMIELHPEWHSDDPAEGQIKVVMTASASDPESWQKHAPSKDDKKKIAARFKDEHDPLKIVIVCDMWLTGFDVPCLHTMYIDKPMRGHNLMQAIARVNRVFKNKPGGLIVDYIGIAGFLKKALGDYTAAGGKGTPQHDLQQAADKMMELYEVVTGMLYSSKWESFFTLPAGERLGIIPDLAEHILGLEDGKKRYFDVMAKLSSAFAICKSRDEAVAIRSHVGLFQAIRAFFVKNTVIEGRSQADIESAIRQIIAQAVGSNEVIDIFAMAGIGRPEISILSEEFLAEVQAMKHKNLAIEALRRLLMDQIKSKLKNNIIQQRSFFALLAAAVRKYTNRSLTTAEVLDELIGLAKGIRDEVERGEASGMGQDEIAFFDALAENESAVEVLGDDKLKELAVLLVERVRGSASIDWQQKDSVRAKMRNIVKRLLRQFGYPPDKQDAAIRLILEQAEALARDWARAG